LYLNYEKDGSYYVVGYFVYTDNRLINFFSPYGKRVFLRLPDLMPYIDGGVEHRIDANYNGTTIVLDDRRLLKVLTEK